MDTEDCFRAGRARTTCTICAAAKSIKPFSHPKAMQNMMNALLVALSFALGVGSAESDSQKVWMFNDANQDKIMNNDIKTHLLMFVSREADYYSGLETAIAANAEKFGDKDILHCILPVEETKVNSRTLR